MLPSLIKGRAPLDATQTIFTSSLDARAIWRDVQAIGAYSVAPTIACCEVAFARIALLKHLVQQFIQNAHEVKDITGRIDQLTRAGFGRGDRETLDHYLLPLELAASQAIAFYLQNAHHSAPLTAVLTDRIGGKREHVLSNSELFRAFASEVGGSLICAFAPKRNHSKRRSSWLQR